MASRLPTKPLISTFAAGLRRGKISTPVFTSYSMSQRMLLRRCAGLYARGLGLSSNRISNGEVEMATSVRAWRRSRSSCFQLPHQQRGETPRRTITRYYSSFLSSPLFAALSPPCFSPTPGGLVDLSDYMMNGCNWRDAPRCPDYVGPVSVERTPDGRGRGLYASRDVAAGDILIISNAFAASYNDPHNIELYSKIAAIVQKSSKALRQFYSLAGYDFHDDMEVPNVKLFDPSVEYVDTGDPAANLEFDEKRIVHIINVNSFEGELPSMNAQPDSRLTGLWLLPSLINHCCSPNANRLVVGEAMFILATCNIQAKEEITISYTDSMSPLKKREDNLGAMGYGFQCQCKRCLTERSVQQELKEFSERYHELYDMAANEVHTAATSEVRLSVDKSPACAKLYGLYQRLAQKVRSMNGLTKLEQKWILGSYSSAYLGKWIVNGYASAFRPRADFVGYEALELVEAMKATVPGMLRTLSFLSILIAAAREDELVVNLVHLVVDECIRLYGKQRLDVTIKLIEQARDIVPFF